MSIVDTIKDSLIGQVVTADQVAPFVFVPASLWFTPNKKYGIATQNSDNSILSLQFGIILEEDHTLESTITEHPVEVGSPISDHIQKQMRKGSLKALVSNHSIIRGFTPQPPPTEPGRIANYAAKFTRPEYRQRNVAANAFALLKALWEAEQLVTITCVMDTYTNIGISNISVHRNGDSGSAIEFDLNFQEVRTVKIGTKVVSIRVTPNPNSAASKKVQPSVSKGKVPTKDAHQTDPSKVVKPTFMQGLSHQLGLS